MYESSLTYHALCAFADAKESVLEYDLPRFLPSSKIVDRQPMISIIKEPLIVFVKEVA